MGIRAPLPAIMVAAVLCLSAQGHGQQSSSSSPSSSSRRRAPAKTANQRIDAGSITDNSYRNSSFGFTYKIPFGWVERTSEMQEDDAGDKPADSSQAQVLLAIFERPPQAIGDTVNSAVVIAAESVKSYPGLKAAVDYFGPLEEITKAKGFKVVQEPYEFSVGSKKLAREDFSKELGKVTMQQGSLVMLEKGYVVSFTFIAGTEDEVEDLVEGLNFAPMKGPVPSPKSKPKK